MLSRAALTLVLLASACRKPSSAAASDAGPEPVRTRPLVHDGDAVFFVGNSLLGWGNRPLPRWVAALGRSVSPPVRIEVDGDIVFGNAPLRSFLDHETTRAALASRKYKVFVLQAEETEPVDRTAEFEDGVRAFQRAVVGAGATPVLFMTWELPGRPFIDQLSAEYDRIGAELGIAVIPAGFVYKDCARAPLRGEGPFWLTADAEHPGGTLHPNEKGMAVSAYSTFELLTGVNPRGANFTAPGNTNSAERMRYFSAMAWARVRPRLR